MIINNSGIYSITNKINNKRYIGSAINLNRRKYEHFRMLRLNKHYNKYLQSSYNKYGEENINFSILEIVENPKNLIEREQYYIDTLKPEYNSAVTAGSMLGFKHSKESIELIKKNHFYRGKGINNPDSKKCYQYDLNGSFIKEWNCITDIERELGFKNSLIIRCLKRRTRTAFKHQWLYEYQGNNIEPIKVKECKDGIRNIQLFNYIRLATEYCKDCTLSELSKVTGMIKTKLTGILFRYKKHLKYKKIGNIPNKNKREELEQKWINENYPKGTAYTGD